MICCSCTSGSTFVLCAVHVKIQQIDIVQIDIVHVLYMYCRATFEDISVRKYESTFVLPEVLSYESTKVLPYFRTSVQYYLRWYESTFVLSYQLVVRVCSCTRNRYLEGTQLSRASSMQLKVLYVSIFVRKCESTMYIVALQQYDCSMYLRTFVLSKVHTLRVPSYDTKVLYSELYNAVSVQCTVSTVRVRTTTSRIDTC